MKIGDLEKQSGISAYTLRYYEKEGLLMPSKRGENNYRHYSQDDLITAKFIKRSKACGFSLSETASLLAIKTDKSQHVCAEAKSITHSKIQEIEEQIQRLQHMQETLIQLEKYCCGGQESAEFCSIISALEQDQIIEKGE
ncbi:Zn(2+)-responsive transcriptional regulator [Marinomonas sp. 15G1-11]|uniref:Zn(2+)-responsive transcriptional regulator n=1 Tax=Marinomonas phaeophyticola TaxID=3004091 RepID=A0ABT4JWJ4_9GAMM|nr:Zn(2+)-responsive transcriptional regulator [Marinomonas sp. 15G1-11]MCZ2721934.1 Zn(2+)-responsive transcriptional regulator [Marinomonas sp. 15G1-11]